MHPQLLFIPALFSGILIPLQAGANAALGRSLGHPLWAALVSLAVSTICILPALLILRVSAPTLDGVSREPGWIWVGGVVGVIYVVAAIIIAPKLGAASFMTTIIAGQLLGSLAVDYFGLVGFAARTITLPRIAGVLLVVMGVLILQVPSHWWPQATIAATDRE